MHGFERDLRANSNLMAAVQTDDFARALYAALSNVQWLGAPDETAPRGIQRFSCSWRSAGGFVADLRGDGEDYLDFYLSGNEGTVRADVREVLSKCGWRPASREDALLDEEELKRLIAEWKTRPARHVEPWLAKFDREKMDFGAVEPETVPDVDLDNARYQDILRWLSETARVSATEAEIGWDLLPL